jgi:anti-anti-sigma factor
MRLSGEIDDAAAAEVRERLDEQLAGDGDVLVDAGDVSFIDVGGCRAIAATAARMTGDRRLVLRDAPPQLLRVLAICGWDRQDHLEVIPREAAT